MNCLIRALLLNREPVIKKGETARRLALSHNPGLSVVEIIPLFVTPETAVCHW